ncbi:uncharacterized protein LOC142604774 [Balearica regulorum gibbericeps]|uniref:uncharacterized protein LOC142604774 n=1 Tax=Balearica regulorum gibbericeps TaxID=100784 RepID=UPI003F5F1108
MSCSRRAWTELRQEAATSDLSPVQPLVKQRDRKCQDRDDRHSPDAWPVDPWEQESEGEAAPGQAKEVSASSAPHGAGAAGVTLLSPTWWSTDELAVYLESALPKLQADEEATEEIKSFGGEAEDVRAQIPTEGLDPCPSRLSTGSDRLLQLFLREYDHRLSIHTYVSHMMETNKKLSQQLSQAERKASMLEKEVGQLKETLQEKTLALHMREGELSQAHRQAKKQYAPHFRKEQERKHAVEKVERLQQQLAQLQRENRSFCQKLRKAKRKKSGLENQVYNLKETLSEKTLAIEMRERELNQAQSQANELAQLRSENLLLRQQLEDMKNKTAQEQMMCELSAQLELESEISLQLEARNQELRELVALLPHRLATPEEGHATTALYGKQWEQRAQEADREMRGLTPRLQTQAAAQARREEIKTTDTSWKEPLMQTIRVLTWDLERAWSMQEETARQLAEIKSSK